MRIKFATPGNANALLGSFALKILRINAKLHGDINSSNKVL